MSLNSQALKEGDGERIREEKRRPSAKAKSAKVFLRWRVENE
jgi:hypothetical protein